jgi:hypothetical protein
MSDDGNLEQGGANLDGQADEEKPSQDEGKSDSPITEGDGLQAGIAVVAQEAGEVAGEVVVEVVGGIIESIFSD